MNVNLTKECINEGDSRHCWIDNNSDNVIRDKENNKIESLLRIIGDKLKLSLIVHYK
ncbi:hypothetical protein AADZ91_14700 [Colwelliaceae bacterium 6441]